MPHPWMYRDEPLTEAPEDYFGFVYLITDLETERAYVGKKQFWRLLTKRVKGRKNKKHFKLESDWKDYTSSSDEVKALVEQKGVDKFRFEILRLCVSKGDLTFGEVEEQIKRDVLTAKLPNGEWAYLNGNVMNRFFRRK